MRSLVVSYLCVACGSLPSSDPVHPNGDPSSGDSHLNADSFSGDRFAADAFTGDTQIGDSVSGDGLSGDSVSGDSIERGDELSSGDASVATCPQVAAGIELGRVSSTALVEISGLTASRLQTDLLWVHNDSGDDAKLYAINTAGELLTTLTVTGVVAADWEDIAIGPGALTDAPFIYIGDIGDNPRARATIEVVRILEPVVTLPPPTELTANDAEVLSFAYPDAAHDAETLLIDPRSGDLFVVTKESNGVSDIYRAPAPLLVGLTTLELIATHNFGALALTTGGEISPLGDQILVRTYYTASLWLRRTDSTVSEAFLDAPCTVPIRFELQGEAIGFAADGSGYFTVSEGNNVPLFFYAYQ